MLASAGFADAHAETQNSSSSSTRRGSFCAASHSSAGTSRSSSPWASGGRSGSWRRAAASSAATARSSSPSCSTPTGSARSSRCVAEAPAHARRQRVVLALDAVAVGLGPDEALRVGDPRAAHVEVEPAQRAALQPDAPADPVARLEHAHAVPARLELAGGDQPGETGADHEHVGQARRRAKPGQDRHGRRAWWSERRPDDRRSNLRQPRRRARALPRATCRACPSGRRRRSPAACRSTSRSGGAWMPSSSRVRVSSKTTSMSKYGR